MVLQEYRDAFRRSLEPQRERGFFLCGQLCDFLHRLMKRVVKRSDLPDESDKETLRSFDFARIEYLSVPDFIQKNRISCQGIKSRQVQD